MLLVFIMAGDFCLHLGNFESYVDMLDLIKICLSRSLLTWVGDLVHRELGRGPGAPLVSLIPGPRRSASYCRVGAPLTAHKGVCVCMGACACVCTGLCVARCMHMCVWMCVHRCMGGVCAQVYAWCVCKTVCARACVCTGVWVGCVSMCSCTCACVYTCVHVCAQLYAWYMCTWVCVCMHVCAHVFVCTGVCVRVCMCVHRCMQCMYACVCKVYMHVCANMHVCAQVFARMCVHVGGCVHTGTRLLPAFPGGQYSQEASELLKLQEPAGWCSVPSPMLRGQREEDHGEESWLFSRLLCMFLAFYSCSFFQWPDWNKLEGNKGRHRGELTAVSAFSSQDQSRCLLPTSPSFWRLLRG